MLKKLLALVQRNKKGGLQLLPSAQLKHTCAGILSWSSPALRKRIAKVQLTSGEIGSGLSKGTCMKCSLAWCLQTISKTGGSVGRIVST